MIKIIFIDKHSHCSRSLHVCVTVTLVKQGTPSSLFVNPTREYIWSTSSYCLPHTYFYLSKQCNIYYSRHFLADVRQTQLWYCLWKRAVAQQWANLFFSFLVFSPVTSIHWTGARNYHHKESSVWQKEELMQIPNSYYLVHSSNRLSLYLILCCWAWGLLFPTFFILDLIEWCVCWGCVWASLCVWASASLMTLSAA